MKVTIKIRPADYQNAYGTGSWFFQTEDITNISTANVKILSMFDKALMEASTAEEAYVKSKSAKGYTRLESVWKAKLFVDGKLVVDNEAQLITPYTTTFRNALLANMNISYIMRHVTCGATGSPNPNNATVASNPNNATVSSNSGNKAKDDNKSAKDSGDNASKCAERKTVDVDSVIKDLEQRYNKLFDLWLDAVVR